jgi:hypothetical protein
MLDARCLCVALVAFMAAIMVPTAEALTYGDLLKQYGYYPGLYGYYAPPGVNTSIQVNGTAGEILRGLQNRLNGSSFSMTPVATAMLLVLAVVQFFV